MISLREEIANIIAENDDPINFNSDDMYYFMGDEILSKIEKRIDSMIKESENDQNEITFYDPVIKQHYDSRIEAFKQVKKMLK